MRSIGQRFLDNFTTARAFLASVLRVNRYCYPLEYFPKIFKPDTKTNWAVRIASSIAVISIA